MSSTTNYWSMLRSRTTRSLFLNGVFLLSVFLLLNSCNKEPEDIGNTLTPPQDKLYTNATDTVAILAHAELNDSIITSLVTPCLAGSYMDPVFGVTTAGFVTQFALPYLNPAFGPGATPDSVILTLAYNGYYGDTNTLQTLKVYEISEELKADSAYISNSPVHHSDVTLGMKTFRPRPTDSVMVNLKKQVPQLRLNLGEFSSSLGRKILDASADVLSSNDNFQKYFKGVYVTADPQTYKGSILYFDFYYKTTKSKLTLYYHNDTTDSLSISLVPLQYTTARYTTFEHNKYDYANQDLRRQIIYGDTTSGQQTTYVQSMGGVLTKIRLPNIAKWKNAKKIAINEALLYLPCDASTEFNPPAELLLGRLNADGSYYLWGIDASTNLPIYFLKASFISASNEYGFRITTHVQDIIQGKRGDYGLVVIASEAATRANRVVLHGPARAQMPMRLRVTYSYAP